MSEILETIQKDMFERAKAFLDSHIHTAANMDEMVKVAQEEIGFIKAMWCGDDACEEEIKAQTGGVTSRCIPEEQEQISDVCVCCGNRRSTWYIGVKRTKNGISEYGEHAADDVSVGCSRISGEKKNIIGETGRKDMVNFCLYVTLPFNIFHSFQMEWEWSMLKSFAQVLFLATGYCILSIIMSCIFTERLNRIRESRFDMEQSFQMAVFSEIL